MEPTKMGRWMVGVPGLDQKKECFGCNGDKPARFEVDFYLRYSGQSTCVLKQ